MNKQLIKTYFKEFNHWLNGGKLLFKWFNMEPTCWLREDDIVSNNLWNHMESNVKCIIINDEYLEFRKALAEGKTIQCNAKEDENDITYTAYGHTWWVDTTEFKYATTFYRIKPEESKFKVGDWITDGTEVWQHKENCRVKDQSNWSLWKPKLGEWCWFWDDDMRIPLLDNFVYNKVDNVVTFTELDSKPYVANISDKAYQYCEPFLGTLPSTVNTRQ